MHTLCNRSCKYAEKKHILNIKQTPLTQFTQTPCIHYYAKMSRSVWQNVLIEGFKQSLPCSVSVSLTSGCKVSCQNTLTLTAARPEQVTSNDMQLAIAPGQTIHWVVWSHDVPSKYNALQYHMFSMFRERLVFGLGLWFHDWISPSPKLIHWPTFPPAA